MNLERPALSSLDFCIHNGSFESGDADFLYQIIRHLKPKKIIEIGSGNSTKIASLALKQNEVESGESTKHICIEPYEQPWLKDLDSITLIRERIEKLQFDWENELNEGDLLFVDSSHMIRPQGDVLTEYLQIFPRLKQGVFVHIHDIFTPKDYLQSWVINDVRFWNEQYLLEALLSNTEKYEVVAALNFLKHHHYDDLLRVCPYLTADREPGSFYFKVRH
jgi:predicted O-methyltransferase YrrM